MSTLAIELPDALESRFETLAMTHGRTTADFAQEAIFETIADLDDLENAKVEYERVRIGQSKTKTIEEMMREYGMAA